jgi:hypothetical protein
MFCARCSAEAPVDARFCVHCGNPLNGTPLQVQVHPNLTRVHAIIFNTFSVLTVVIGVLLLITNGRSPERHDDRPAPERHINRLIADEPAPQGAVKPKPVTSAPAAKSTDPTSASTRTNEKQTAPAKKKNADESARTAFAGFLTAAYKKLGYIIQVEANGPNKATLELKSMLFWEGSQTMEAALEVLEDFEFFKAIKNLKFSRVLFTSDKFSVEYSVTNGLARQVK